MSYTGKIRLKYNFKKFLRKRLTTFFAIVYNGLTVESGIKRHEEFKMVKSENFYTEESANRKINQLRDEGKRFVIDELIDYDTCEDMPIAYTQITWIEE